MHFLHLIRSRDLEGDYCSARLTNDIFNDLADLGLCKFERRYFPGVLGLNIRIGYCAGYNCTADTHVLRLRTKIRVKQVVFLGRRSTDSLWWGHS